MISNSIVLANSTILKLKGTMYRRGTNLEYRIFGAKEIVLDICSYSNGTFSNIVLKMMVTYMKKVAKETNIFHPCPFSVCYFFNSLKESFFFT